MYSLSPIQFVSPSFTTSSLGPNDPKPGDRMVHNFSEYVFVYNAGNSQISTGQGAICSAVTAGDPYRVTVSSTTSVDLPVGVCRHATIATGYYGFLVTKGFTNIVPSANTGIAAGSLCALAADGNWQAMAVSSGWLSPGLVKAMSAIATGASGLAYVSL